MQSNIWKSYIATNFVLKTPSKLLYTLRKHIKEYSSNKRGMPKLKDLLKPNPSVQGMLVLDKAKFDKVVTMPYINVSQSKLNNVLPHLKKYLIKLPRLKPIQIVDDQTRVYLNPEMILSWNDITPTDKESLNEFDICEKDFNFCDQTLTYDNYMVDEMLKAILPDHQEGTSSFTKVGHIIHLNLREHLLPYKNIIAQILYDKVPHCETVVNKVHIIDNTYRNFQMEILCGKDDLKTKVKQNGCQFEFDFGTVYWNSRLSTEHERIIKLIKKDDVLFDVFAGVGPFSIPVAKKKCVVYANDLNPESYNWLKHNSKLNKINDQYLSIFNKDGKDFILNDIKMNLIKHIDQNVYIVMNLPALAVTFLKYFIGLYTENEIPRFKNPPTIYVYCFAKGEDYTTITEDLISLNLNRDMKDRMEMFRVRTVSSFKEMMRVKFNLTEDILVNKSKCKRPCEESTDNTKRHCHGQEQTSESKEHIQSGGG